MDLLLDQWSLQDQPTYRSDEPTGLSHNASIMVKSSECATTKGSTNFNTGVEGESSHPLSEDNHESVLDLQPLSLTSTEISEPVTSSITNPITDHLTSRALPSSTLFGLNMSSSPSAKQKANQTTLNERDHVLWQQRRDRRPEKARYHVKAPEVDFANEGLKLYPQDSVKATTYGEWQNAVVVTQVSTKPSADFMQKRPEQTISKSDEGDVAIGPHLDQTGPNPVYKANGLSNHSAATLKCSRDTGETRDTTKGAGAISYAIEYPTMETYNDALQQGGCEWRRKRDGEKAVARRVFMVPSDWSNVAKVNEFLTESRRIWAQDL